MPIGSPGCVTRPRRSPPEARWISGAQGGGLTQRRAAVIRQVFDEVLLTRALLNERRRSESNRRIEVLQLVSASSIQSRSVAIPLSYQQFAPGATPITSRLVACFATPIWP